MSPSSATPTHDSERDDRSGRETPRLEPVGGQEQDEQPEADDSQRAAQRQLHPPPAPHFVNDLDVPEADSDAVIRQS